MLHEETQPTVLEETWEAVPPDCVMTAEEVFFKLRVEGYRVQYVRVPSTSGRSPNFAFFDMLVQSIVMHADRETWIVFNCQTGVARSTLAMVAACQIQYWRGFLPSTPASPPPDSPKESSVRDGNSYLGVASGANKGIKRPGSAGGKNDSPVMFRPKRPLENGLDQTERGLLAGWYQV